MFILDDIAMSPFKGLLFIAKEISKACDQHFENDRAKWMAQLSELHKRLELGEISDEEFDETEAAILEALEQFED